MQPIDEQTLRTLVIITALTYPIKMYALWKAARAEQKFWFGGLALINTAGMLDLAYLFYFTKDSRSKKKADKTQD